MAAAEETRAVGFDFRLADGLAIDDGEMRRPDFRFGGTRRRRVARSAPTSAKIFGLDEQLGEGRMRDVRRLRRQHQFGVGGDLDLARARRPNW